MKSVELSLPDLNKLKGVFEMCDKPNSVRLDQEIADRLKHDHPEQFLTLVRMHLSFELDLNTDTELVWNKYFVM